MKLLGRLKIAKLMNAEKWWNKSFGGVLKILPSPDLKFKKENFKGNQSNGIFLDHWRDLVCPNSVGLWKSLRVDVWKHDSNFRDPIWFGKCRGYNPAGEPGCEMWTFEKQEQKCSLYDSAEMKVKTIHELGYSFSLKKAVCLISF